MLGGKLRLWWLLEHFLNTAHLSPKPPKTRKRYNPCGCSVFYWQGQKDLNPRHAVLETAALPTELYPFMVGLRGLEPGTVRL